jgi:hypothetical protein
MTGSGLIDFLITIIVIFGTGALFYVAIERLAPDPMMQKIAKIAVGVVLVVVALLAVKAVLFGGGGAISAGGIIGFAIGLIVIMVVLFIIDKLLAWLGGEMGPVIDIIRYVVFAVALIALLVLADRALFGGQYIGKTMSDSLGTPSIMKPERR